MNSAHSRLRVFRCLIVRTAPYDKDAISKVLQLRANVEGLKLGDGVLDRLATKGEDSSLRCVPVVDLCSALDPLLMAHDRYALQLLTPASILAKLAGRKEVQLEDIDEMGELFLDAKTSANIIKAHQEAKAA